MGCESIVSEEWLNCLVSREENVAGEGSIMFMEDSTYVVKRIATLF